MIHFFFSFYTCFINALSFLISPWIIAFVRFVALVSSFYFGSFPCSIFLGCQFILQGKSLKVIGSSKWKPWRLEDFISDWVIRWPGGFCLFLLITTKVSVVFFSENNSDSAKGLLIPFIEMILASGIKWQKVGWVGEITIIWYADSHLVLIFSVAHHPCLPLCLISLYLECLGQFLHRINFRSLAGVG